MNEDGHSNVHYNHNMIEFFPRRQAGKINKSAEKITTKLPNLYNKFYRNTIESQRSSKPHKRSLSSYDITNFEPSKLKDQGQLYKYLSSKVDFFNEQNQRRLNLQKRKVMVDLGILRFDKQKLIPSNKSSKVSAAMMKLLKGYLLKRSSAENRDDQYYILGRQS